jgi:hypothetical protein
VHEKLHWQIAEWECRWVVDGVPSSYTSNYSGRCICPESPLISYGNSNAVVLRYELLSSWSRRRQMGIS